MLSTRDQVVQTKNAVQLLRQPGPSAPSRSRRRTPELDAHLDAAGVDEAIGRRANVRWNAQSGRSSIFRPRSRPAGTTVSRVGLSAAAAEHRQILAVYMTALAVVDAHRHGQGL